MPGIGEHVSDAVDRQRLFEMIAGSLSERLGIARDVILCLLEEREAESTTAIYPTLAIPHIVVEGERPFAMTVVRLRKGVRFSAESPEVEMVFALAGSRGERDFHLQALMSIAQIVENPGFEERWRRAKDAEELRNLILVSKRRRRGGGA